MVPKTGVKHRELRVKKEKTFSPVRPQSPKVCEPAQHGPTSAGGTEPATPVEAENPEKSTYDEQVQAYVKQRLEWDERRKKKAEQRKAQELQQKVTRSERRKRKADIRNELHTTCEDIRTEKLVWNRREQELVDRIKLASGSLGTHLASEERKPARLNLMALRTDLDEVRKRAFTRILDLKTKQAMLRAQLEELKGNQSVAPPSLHPGFSIVLVAIDDCSRFLYTMKVLGKATEEETESILKAALPQSLKNMITDNGPQFKANDFKEFCEVDAKILHIFTYPHHPNENGRVERVIRTMKDHLELHDWNNEQELDEALVKIKTELNDTPHQGIGYLTPASRHFGSDAPIASSGLLGIPQCLPITSIVNHENTSKMR